MDKVVLEIGMFSSKCQACGGGADPYEKTHSSLLGYGVKGAARGCGKTFTHVTATYLNMDELVSKMRPDLEYIDPFEAHGLSV